MKSAKPQGEGRAGKSEMVFPSDSNCLDYSILEGESVLKIYIAGRYGRRKELAECAEELRAIGHSITSRWLTGIHDALDEKPSIEEARRFALEDLEDLNAADILLAFTEAPGETQGRARGGRHVELGYAIAKGKPICIIGHRENVFCSLPEVFHFDTFRAFYTWGWLWLWLTAAKRGERAD